MAERKVKEQTAWKLPRVRIPASDLFEILSSKSLSKFDISAETADYEFTDLDDIRNHLDLLTENPRIYIGGNELKLSSDLFRSELSRRWSKDTTVDDNQQISDILTAKLKPNRAILFSYLGRFMIKLFFSFVLFNSTYAYILDYCGIEDPFISAILFGVILFCYFSMFGYILDILIPKGPVLFPKTNAFWSKNATQ